MMDADALCASCLAALCGAAFTTILHSVTWYTLVPISDPTTSQQQADTTVQSSQNLFELQFV
jgi:hypothetical protein